MFSWKRIGPAEVGEKGIGTWSLGPEDLYSLWGGVRELHIDMVGKGGAYYPKRGHDLLSISMGGGSLTQIFQILSYSRSPLVILF